MSPVSPPFRISASWLNNLITEVNQNKAVAGDGIEVTRGGGAEGVVISISKKYLDALENIGSSTDYPDINTSGFTAGAYIKIEGKKVSVDFAALLKDIVAAFGEAEIETCDATLKVAQKPGA